jgi:hypothetical protein
VLLAKTPRQVQRLLGPSEEEGRTADGDRVLGWLVGFDGLGDAVYLDVIFGPGNRAIRLNYIGGVE